MILPTKHIKLSESFIGLSGFLLQMLHKPITMDKLWQNFQQVNNTDTYPAYHGIDNVVLSLNLLFAMGAVNINEDGKLYISTTKNPIKTNQINTIHNENSQTIF